MIWHSLCFLLAVMSVADMALTVHCLRGPHGELYPIAYYYISVDPSFGLFVALKGIGTVVVIYTIYALQERFGYSLLAPLLAVQFLTLVYVLFA